VPEGREGPEGPLGVARDIVRAGLASLETNRERIDNLNVYPVPDGDTGTNMTLTMRSVRDALDSSSAEREAEVASAVTRACLMGARGNSGVILSQIIRGALEALVDASEVDVSALATTLRRASEAGYESVREPQEGTILTVARALAERAEELGPDLSLGDALAEVVRAGEAALARTQEQLPMLREAGVVDAGGAGLLELVRGIGAHVRGEPLPEAPIEAERLPLEAIHRELSRFRYCTSFFVEGEDADPEELRREFGRFGDSLLVVGSRGAVKVHFHTDEPGRALSRATAVGVVEEVDIKNMHAQTAARTERLLSNTASAICAVVAVCAGAGNIRLFESLGASRIVAGGQSMNPPTADIVAAIEAVPAEEVIVLPNNKNVVLAAEQAIAATDKSSVLVPTVSIQAGLSAMVPFDPARTAEANAHEMGGAAAAVREGAVTRASRTAVLDGLEVEEGQFLGLVDGDPVTSGPVLDVVAREVVERLLVDRSDVLTILLGERADGVDRLREEIETAYPELEIDVHEGGQPHYPLLFSVE
jgi:uncharacterized protein